MCLTVVKLKWDIMFDFEKLKVYGQLRALNRVLLPLLFRMQREYPYLTDQMKRASLSAMLNLSEGAGRMTGPDKRQFFIRSRASVYECVSILHVLIDHDVIKSAQFDDLYGRYEEISKMLLGMIRSTK
jgi:four helix bundle protein